jgi:hypothetical protein
MKALKDLKNSVDFFLRNQLSWGRHLDTTTPIDPKAAKFQSEVQEFLKLFNWPDALGWLKLPLAGRSLRVADIGTRTFVTAPVFERLFGDFALPTEIRGFEIDANRRFINFRRRADYGRYYAQQVKSGFFHPDDFMKWNQPLDVAFLLHPFVTPEPHLSWGLPLKSFKPRELFDHTRNLPSASGGLLVLSCPSADELEISHKLATQAGFQLIERRNWIPKINTLQQKPRLGCLYQL